MAVPNIELELLGKTRHLRLVSSTPVWYAQMTGGKKLSLLVTRLQHQVSVTWAAQRTNEAHALALGVPVEQLPAEETVDATAVLDPKDAVDMEGLVPDVCAAFWALAHWEDVVARPQGHKDVAQPGELLYEDIEVQLDLADFPLLLASVIEVYGVMALNVAKKA